ncbi:MAG: S8 family serine peptidase, partial [Clostridia bacterium]|nr:S8 family serine peptidase [Clostridia bacterium]
MKKKAITLCAVLLVIGIAVTGLTFGFTGKEIATKDTSINTLAEIQNFREELNAEIENDTLLAANEEAVEELSEFALKRLVANGDIENTYGAIKDIEGYLDYHILCYATEEDAEYAYEKLVADGVLVVADGIVESEWAELSEQSTSSAKNVGENSWAYQCMSAGGINQKIDSNRTMSKKQKVVVVIDSGINTEHKMFSDRFLKKKKKIVGEAIKNTTMISKYKFEDDHGHGSHVAGIICGFTPENVKIIPIKISNLLGLSELSAMISAFAKVEEYAKKYDV